MEKYNSKETIITCGFLSALSTPRKPSEVFFKSEDGKNGMRVGLKEIIDGWLKTLEPERQRTLELEESKRVALEDERNKHNANYRLERNSIMELYCGEEKEIKLNELHDKYFPKK